RTSISWYALAIAAVCSTSRHLECETASLPLIVEFSMSTVPLRAEISPPRAVAPFASLSLTGQSVSDSVLFSQSIPSPRAVPSFYHISHKSIKDKEFRQETACKIDHLMFT